MAQVNPVEYQKNSSTAGFAVAGDKKEINKTTAAPIQKDVNQGNTKPLDNGQKMYLDKVINPDDVEYTTNEQIQVGKNQVNTDGATGKSSFMSTGGTTTGAGLSMAGGGGYFINGNGGTNAFSTGPKPPAQTNSTPPSGNSGSGGSGGNSGGGADAKGVQESAQNTENTAKIPWMALAAGAIALAGGAMALVCAKKFDDQLGKRNQFKDQSDNIKQTIQNYYDTLSADINSMSENVQAYEDLSNSKVETFEINMNEITVLTCEMQEAALNGDAKAVEQKQQKIDELKQAQTDDSLESECQSLRDGMAEYDSHYNESLGVADSSTLVANFLKQGDKMAKLATAQLVFLTIGMALMAYGSVRAVIAAAKVPLLAKPVAFIVAAAGAAMMLGGTAMVACGAAKMGEKMKQEKECNTKGIEIAEKVTELQTNEQNQIATNSATIGMFDEADGTTETTIDETQQEADEIAQENEKQLQKEMASGDTVTPEVTNKTSKKQPELETNAA